MLKQRLLHSTPATLATICMLAPSAPAFAWDVTNGPASSPEVGHYATDVAHMPALTHAQKLALLQRHIKYVFVLFQENRSYDQHFGTFPGGDGLFSKSAAKTPGFVQPIVDTDGTEVAVSPFRIPATVIDANDKTVQLYPADTDSVDHSHAGIANSIDLAANGVARNDRYALNAEGLTTIGGKIVLLATGKPATTPPTLVQKQRAELTMSHLDCDTIPFLWQYADRFTMFDNFHQTIVGPSTPNAIAMIAGQSGDTQWVLHPDQASNVTKNAGGGVPVTADPGPFAGSDLDTSKGPKPPYGPNDESPKTPTVTQTYASLPLSFMGTSIKSIVAKDENPALDLVDVKDDIKSIAANNPKQVPWGWYQEGYDHEPTDGSKPATNENYITHHNGPQYFGYVGDNPTEQGNLHGLGDFYSDVKEKKLPSHGVFYVRGGYGNLDGLVPVDPNKAVRAAFIGDDDHPAYSDAQISEALVADEVNAIANSAYWPESAIIIGYDETDGLYDHASFKPRSVDPKGLPLDGGPRIPAIVISPFAVSHGIAHDYSEHSSVIKFIDELFGLVPLGNLPDEFHARALGKITLKQDNLGPADTLAGMGDLFSAFDNGRLAGTSVPLPGSYATIPAAAVTTLPHYGGEGCKVLHIVPTDIVDGRVIDPPPADFNPRPGTTPGLPTGGAWTP